MDVTIFESLGLSGLGICTVFIVLILLMAIIRVMASANSKKTAAPAASPAPAVQVEEKPTVLAPGSCGDFAIGTVPDRVAAMVMAITADQLGKPLNELRFISIKEVK